MLFTLKVIVQPLESTEEDRNIYLVRRGFPISNINRGFNTESRMDSEFQEVQQVVVFGLEINKLQSAQKEYLEHLRRTGVVKSWGVYGPDEKLIEES